MDPLEEKYRFFKKKYLEIKGGDKSWIATIKVPNLTTKNSVSETFELDRINKKNIKLGEKEDIDYYNCIYVYFLYLKSEKILETNKYNDLYYNYKPITDKAKQYLKNPAKTTSGNPLILNGTYQSKFAELLKTSKEKLKGKSIEEKIMDLYNQIEPLYTNIPKNIPKSK